MKPIPLLLALFFAAVLSVSAQETALIHKEFLVINEETGDGPGYLFSSIGIVKTHNHTIYLSDRSDNAIRVFNQKGEFIQKMGGRGRGPGEFHHLTDFNILHGELVALDRFQSRVTFFDLDGNYTSSFVSEVMPVGVAIFIDCYDEDTFVVGHRDVSNPENEGYLLHLYNADFSQKTGEDINVYDYFFDRSSRFERRISNSPIYLTNRFGSNPGSLLIAPYHYNGTFLMYNKATHTEKLVGEIISNPLVEHDWDKREELFNSGKPGFASSSGTGGKFIYRMKGANFGLLGNSRFILHYYGLFTDKEILPYLTIYTASGDFLTTVDLSDTDIPFIRENRFDITARHLDEENRVYYSVYGGGTDYPSLQVYELNLDDFTNE